MKTFRVVIFDKSVIKKDYTETGESLGAVRKKLIDAGHKPSDLRITEISRGREWH